MQGKDDMLCCAVPGWLAHHAAAAAGGCAAGQQYPLLYALLPTSSALPCSRPCQLGICASCPCTCFPSSLLPVPDTLACPLACLLDFAASTACTFASMRSQSVQEPVGHAGCTIRLPHHTQRQAKPSQLLSTCQPAFQSNALSQVFSHCHNAGFLVTREGCVAHPSGDPPLRWRSGSGVHSGAADVDRCLRALRPCRTILPAHPDSLRIPHTIPALVCRPGLPPLGFSPAWRLALKPPKPGSPPSLRC